MHGYDQGFTGEFYIFVDRLMLLLVYFIVIAYFGFEISGRSRHQFCLEFVIKPIYLEHI